MKRLIPVLFSFMLLFLLVTPIHAEGPEGQTETKTIRLHMDYFGEADVWILHKVGSVTVDQAAFRISTSHRYNHEFATTPSEMIPGKFYLLVNLSYQGLYKIELTEENEQKLLELSKYSPQGYISMSAITQLAKKLDEDMGEE